ncbi:MAG: MotA/TolQ/ExbB proton channel family protein [Lachnospiraceae bacterium]|nr:MotA/TolQ/ExbB proton channel family protein [Lachnospiraceae bacterium]
MDLASILGLVLCFGLIIYGIINGESGIDFSAISNFIDLSSVYITIGGSISCMMASYELKEFLSNLKSFALIFKSPKVNTQEIIQKIIDLSNVARKEGLLSLEEAAGDLDDEFLKKGILLIVDGTDPELVRAIMETELASVEGRHNKVVSFYERFAAMGPAWGMIGTLIGLVNMLYNMEDSSKIGPSMAVALLTTLYGSMIANWLCLPASFKMKNFNAEEMMVKEIMIEGLLSIQAGENPRVIEEKLKSFLSPVQRKATAGSDDGGEE